MDANTRPRPSLDRYELLYRLMVIAAIAVILVSLVGIASMTGLLPRVGDGRPNSEAVPDKRSNDGARPDGSQPADKQLRILPARHSGTALVQHGPRESLDCSVATDLRVALVPAYDAPQASARFLYTARGLC
jgi:hypothetical protein